MSSGTTLCALALVQLSLVHAAGQSVPPDDSYLSWSVQQAQEIGRSMHEDGRVGGFFDGRLLNTDRSYNYKLKATWLTPEVVRATARLVQLQSRLSDEVTRQLVAEAEALEGTVILVEIDPREGSGVIPLSWEAFLQPHGEPSDSSSAVAGRRAPELRSAKALSGVLRRDYDYDRFWVVFPLTHSDGSPVFSVGVEEAELVVRIYEKEGRVRWRIPSTVRERLGVQTIAP